MHNLFTWSIFMKTVLVADAEPAIRKALRSVLECEECRVVTTSSVDDTLTVLSYLKPNLIIAERGLGLLVLNRLQSRQLTPPAPILLLTDTGETEVPSGCEFLKRPFEGYELINTATRLMGTRCGGAAAA
jgi:DNA-binding response OmpR family regulator